MSVKKKILFADDPEQEESLNVYKSVFTSDGYEVLIATSEKDVLETIKKQSPDLLVFDEWLSGRRGIALIQKLREEGNTLKIIIITTNDLSEITSQVSSLSVSAVLSKPLELLELKNAIQQALSC